MRTLQPVNRAMALRGIEPTRRDAMADSGRSRDADAASAETPSPLAVADLCRRVMAAVDRWPSNRRHLQPMLTLMCAMMAQLDAAYAPIDRFERRFAMPIRGILARCRALRANQRVDRAVLSTLRIGSAEALRVEREITAARRRARGLERRLGICREALRDALTVAVDADGARGFRVSRRLRRLPGRLRRDVLDVLTKLAPREAHVLRLRFGIAEPSGYTLAAIGRRLGVSTTRVRQIEANALRKLRHPNGSRRLREFMRDENERAHSSGWSEPPAHNR